MKWLITLLLALGVALLSIACGGDEGTAPALSLSPAQRDLRVGLVPFALEEEHKLMAAVAANFDAENADTKAVLYLGDPEKHPLELPTGKWLLVVSDWRGNLESTVTTITARPAGPVELPSEIPDDPSADASRSRQEIGDVADFLMAVTTSGPVIEERLQQMGSDPSPEDEDLLLDLFDELYALAERADQAWRSLVESSGATLEDTAAGLASPAYVLALGTPFGFAPSLRGDCPYDSPAAAALEVDRRVIPGGAPSLRAAPPLIGPAGAISAICFGFSLKTTNDAAVKRVLFIFENHLTDAQKREVFRTIQMDAPGIPGIQDEPGPGRFMLGLRRGDYDKFGLRIESVAQRDPEYGQVSSELKQQVGQLWHKVGADLAQRGAKVKGVTPGLDNDTLKKFYGPKATATPTPPPAGTATPTPTATATAAPAGTATATPAGTATATPAGTVTATPAGTATATPAGTGTATPPPTATATPPPTPTPTPAPGATPTPTPTSEPSPTPTSTPTLLNRLTDMEVTLGLLGQGDEPGTLNLQVTVRVFFILGEEDATVSCTSEKHQASENFAVHSFEAYATDVLWTEDLRSGQNYTVTCSISDGNTLSKTVKVAGEGEKVTAVGGYVGESVASKTVVRNTMTLTFDTAGGPGSVEGQGNVDQEFEGSVFACPVGETTWSTERWVIDYYGAYDPDSNTFSGTMEMFHVSESWFGGGDDPCWKDVREKELSREWQATLEDGVVKGSLAPPVDSQWTFELTVQG